MIPECSTCKRNMDETTLIKCPVCHKHACLDHQVVRSGRLFCSKRCADYFFFGDEDD